MILLWAAAAFFAALLHLLCLNTSVIVAVLIFILTFAAENVLFLIYLIFVGFTVDTSKPLEKKNNIANSACHRIIEFCCTYYRVKVNIIDKDRIPEDSKFLIVSNHRSGFDPLALGFALKEYDIAFISKPSNMKLPVIGKVAFGGGYQAIDRENDRNALRTILAAANYIKKDICSIGIYPEGTRNRTDDLLPFHAGSFKIAQKANAPIVVVATQGAEKIVKNAPFKKTTVKIDIVDVISAEDVKVLSTNDLAERAKHAIETKLAEGKELL